MIATDMSECEQLLPVAVARAARGHRLRIVVCPSRRRCDERSRVATEAELFDLLAHARGQRGVTRISAHVGSLGDGISRVLLGDAEIVILGVNRNRAIYAPRRQAYWRERLSLIANTTAVVPGS
jgi:hypothetical protein